jgi:UDP-glucuronate decarboxylase
MKRVLVTGGAGFIGSHLCKRLLDKGCDVICLDNYFSGSKNNVVELMSNPNFDVIRHDVVDPYTAEVDEIYNLACPASPIHYQFNPVKTTRTSVLGTINMLELARRKGAKMFQASTSEIYGDPHEAPQKEDYWGNVDPIGVRACYEEGKRCAETLCFGYHRQKEVEIKVARIFNTYGPNMNPADGSVMSNFISQALRGEDIVINGNGEQTRSFMYIDDLIDAMLLLMDTPEGFTGPINLGSAQLCSIKDLAQKIVDLTGSKSRIIFQESAGYDPVSRCPDITLAGEVLGWTPRVSLDEGLKKTIEYFKTKI